MLTLAMTRTKLKIRTGAYKSVRLILVNQIKAYLHVKGAPPDLK